MSRKKIREHQIQTMKVDDLVPADYNPRTITDGALAGLNKSMERFGNLQPIIWNKKTKNVVGGHQRLRVLKEKGVEETQVVVVSMNKGDERAANVSLNNPHIQGEFSDSLSDLLVSLEDFGVLATDFEELSLGALLGADRGEETEDDSTVEEDLTVTDLYTKRIVSPVYEIQGEKPAVGNLFDDEKTKALMAEIGAADLPDDIACFLRKAAERHTSFHFRRIAEFYAHASPEVQRLMEDSALVIVDFDRAIELGFVKITEKLRALTDGAPDA